MALYSGKKIFLLLLCISMLGCGGGNSEQSAPGTSQPTSPPPPTDPTQPENPDAYGSEPIIFWPKPAYAHPDIPFDFTMIAADMENNTIIYQLKNAPSDMSIDSQGKISWPAQYQTKNVDFSVLVDDGRQQPIEIPVHLSVDSSQFLFVSPTGDDTNDGSINTPFKRIDKGLKALAEKGYGHLMIRGGTYQETWNWEVNGVRAPTFGAAGSADKPYIVSSFPGEMAILDTAGGHGYWSYNASFWLYKDLEIKNAGIGERGGMMVTHTSNAAQNITVRDSNWSRSENCTGFYLNGSQAICHRCKAFNNYDRNSDHWNSSNYLVYTSGQSSDAYILDSYSEGSISGYKIKHSGPGKLLIHNSKDVGSHIGFGGMDDDSSITFNTFVNNKTALLLGITDPHPPYTQGNIRVAHNTVVEPADVGIEIQTSYGAEKKVFIENNVFQSAAGFSNQANSPLAIRVWEYTNSTNLNEEFVQSKNNCWISSSNDIAFKWGNEEAYDFASWQHMGKDTQSLWTDVLLDENYRITNQSPCY
ncbi:hypothetical protein [Teredinibacter sp. KSP-S5-2]|uniref:hypothetical protein n=1 Tax=Teredinibacter sp. KSP-S5-2 TaxID=3034506 RepID=UPI002934C210|nr:hypothetical protein [Teredinibacter sp. KSP-S5-2]WNO10034.1 hypothetical protein P5V12_02500 [Teredinibacter sp. KSP-S5-2]